MTRNNRQTDQLSTDIFIANNSQFAEIIFNGAVTRKILDDSFFKLISHAHFKFNMNACYDYSNAYADLEMPDIQEHSQFVSAHSGKRGNQYKLALISNDTLNHALLSVYKLLISKTSVEAEVFSDKTRAISWLTNTP